jgi:hypothetical protein
VVEPAPALSPTAVHRADEAPELRFGIGEWLGAIGDAGTLVPILLALSVLNGIDLGRALLLSGIVYVGSALYYRLPVPVQPLKAMAAVALLRGLDTSVITAAALIMGVTFTLFGTTGLVPRLERFFPRPIIKGVQAGVGVMLFAAALRLLRPAGPSAGFAVHAAATLEPFDFVTAFFLLVLPQLPLTLGNAVFASADALRSYYGERADRATPATLATTIGLTNIAAFLLGAYPLCHGSGGVTAHYRFGARTGGATLLFGAALIVVALLFPFTSFEILSGIPPAALGLMLLYVALRHLQLAWSGRDAREILTIVIMAGVALATANLTYSLLAGWVTMVASQAHVRRWAGGSSIVT